MDFVALDFETANADLSSICQVGIACFLEGKVQFSWESLIDPRDYFDHVNISIHGITPEMVACSPTWDHVYPAITQLLSGSIVVSHTAFDRVALQRACERAGLPVCSCTWLDSTRVVRRTWECFSRSGYGLANVAEYLGIQYAAHNALEDARCAGEVLIRALVASNIDLRQWLVRAHHPIHAPQPVDGHSPYEPDPNGHFFGEVLVFTGALSLTRPEAAAIAARAGCTVADGVTKHTTMLVVGNQDIQRLAGFEKSAKHRKAEALILKGQRIQILTESDFLTTIACLENAAPPA